MIDSRKLQKILIPPKGFNAKFQRGLIQKCCMVKMLHHFEKEIIKILSTETKPNALHLLNILLPVNRNYYLKYSVLQCHKWFKLLKREYCSRMNLQSKYHYMRLKSLNWYLISIVTFVITLKQDTLNFTKVKAIKINYPRQTKISEKNSNLTPTVQKPYSSQNNIQSIAPKISLIIFLN